jgi:hypothetical protein
VVNDWESAMNKMSVPHSLGPVASSRPVACRVGVTCGVRYGDSSGMHLTRKSRAVNPSLCFGYYVQKKESVRSYLAHRCENA